MNLLITGASRGLGYEMAAAALERGHSVIAGTRSLDVKSSKLSLLEDKYGPRLHIVPLDVTDEQGIASLASILNKEGTKLGAIVNNAGILTARSTPIEELDMQQVAKTFEVNLYGPMRVLKHFLPLMTETDAAIINISSEAGSISNAYPGDYPYAISKSALNMFTAQLRSLLKDQDIQVLSVHPGWMKTDMGGEDAPTSAGESAAGILDLIERKVVPKTKFNFVDYSGNEMPI
ncbi:SDR family oxidoreductase [Paenibacillus zeisoli]|uniref:SDR family oxidoreductase n=1 Tax=Paenibacillus zeisoli TaxID=2496267 RepID=A0A433XQW0_9BACL|nr:SDR family oxidoreductase [Paenibacillus zeisoli]RUT36503.1 SDR family oxidoreductase [Paenibacillus zeisoli]